MSVDLFDGPLTANVDPMIAAQINQIFESLTKTQQGLLAVKSAAPETETAFRQLYQSFAAGHTSIVGVRAELERMAQGAPKTAAEIREMAKASREAAETARPYWENLDRLSERLDKVAAGNRRAGASIGEFAAAVSHGFHAIESVASTVEAAVERIATRSAEGMRLARIQAELGVNFAEAQAQSRRFVSQTEIAGLTEHFASARMNLSQQEIGALTRGGARLAQMNGTSFEEQGGRIFSGIVGGELEVLRRFGPEMAALSGQAHTARERLEMFQRVVRDLGEPVDDAATSLERFRESVAQGERALASGFTAELERIAAPGGLLAGFTDGLGVNERALRDLGTAAGRSLGVAATATLGWLDTLSRVRGALGDVITRLHDPAWQRLRGLAPERSTVTGALRRAATFALGAETAGSLEMLVAGGTEEEDLGAGRATGAQAPDRIETDAQRHARERQEERLAEWRLETAQGAVRKENDPAGVAARNFRGIDAAQRRAGAAGRRQERADWQAILNASLDTKRQAEADRIMTWEGLAAKVRLTAELQTRADDELSRAIEEMRSAAERKGIDNLNENEERDRTMARDRAESDRRNGVGERLRAQFEDPENTPEARAARAIGAAWSQATDALGTHLGLVASGQETWADFWDALGTMALKTLSEVASTEGKLEFGRALAALAVGNFPGAALHTAAGLALTGVGAALGAASGSAPSAPSGGTTGRSGASASQRVPRMDSSASSDSKGPVTISVSFGGASFYGSGGPRQAAAELVGLLNSHAPLSGAVLDARVTGRT